MCVGGFVAGDPFSDQNCTDLVIDLNCEFVL